MIMKSCRTCGTRIHLKVLPSSIQSLYNTPSSLINIFCSSLSLCNFFATSLQYVSFFCSSCNCFGFNGSLISHRSSCSVISTQGFVHDSQECSRNSLPLSNFRFSTDSSSNLCNSMPLVRLGLTICVVKSSYYLVRHCINKITLLFCLGGSSPSLNVCKVKCIPGDPTTTCPVLFKGSRSPLSLA